MKKIISTVVLSLLPLFLFSQDLTFDFEEDTDVITSLEINEEKEETESDEVLSLAGYAKIPDAKRPKTPDKEKVSEAAKRDESEKTSSEYKDTLKFGTPTEISEIVDKLVKNEDPRFVDDLYDLFQITKSSDIKEKVISYFSKLEDPCLEDFAVMVLNDPFDEKQSLVKKCFDYVGAVKCKAAVPAVFKLIENEDEAYFNYALTCAGEIGGEKEAVALTQYLDRDDFSDAQKQSLMKVLGKLHAVETWDKLVEICEDEDENLFVRMYAAEAIGAMEKEESVPVLQELFEKGDPNLRQYALKGLSYFPDVLEAKSVIIQAVRDDHVKVRLEAISIIKKLEIKDSVPYLIYRAQNDSEDKVKQESYSVIAFLNTREGNDFLCERVSEKKGSDSLKSKAVEVLLKENHTGDKEIKDLCELVLSDDRRKPLRYNIGKQIAKYARPGYGDICVKYLESKDSTTVGLGLDIYQNGKYAEAIPQLEKIAEDKKQSTNSKRAKKLLGKEDE